MLDEYPEDEKRSVLTRNLPPWVLIGFVCFLVLGILANVVVVYLRNDKSNDTKETLTSTIPSRWAWWIANGDSDTLVTKVNEDASFLDESDSEGWTFLHACVGSARYDLARTAVKLGSDVNAVTDRGFTPLHFASFHAKDDHVLSNDESFLDFIDFLLRSGADPNGGVALSSAGSPIAWASTHNLDQLTELMERYGGDARENLPNYPKANIALRDHIRLVRQECLDAGIAVKGRFDGTERLSAHSQIEFTGYDEYWGAGPHTGQVVVVLHNEEEAITEILVWDTAAEFELNAQPRYLESVQIYGDKNSTENYRRYITP